MQAVRESSAVSRKLFETGYAYKKAALKRGDLSGGRFGPFWDQLVFSKVKARLGGASRLILHCTGLLLHFAFARSLLLVSGSESRK